MEIELVPTPKFDLFTLIHDHLNPASGIGEDAERGIHHHLEAVVLSTGDIGVVKFPPVVVIDSDCAKEAGVADLETKIHLFEFNHTATSVEGFVDGTMSLIAKLLERNPYSHHAYKILVTQRNFIEVQNSNVICCPISISIVPINATIENVYATTVEQF